MPQWGAQRWTLDWLTFSPYADDRDANGVQWILTNEKGFWGAPKTGATVSGRLNQHGMFRSPGWKTDRTISLTGRFYCMDYTVLRAAEAAVQGLLSDPNTPGLLTCFSEIGPLEIEVFLDDVILCQPLDVASEPGIEFSLQLVAPDPRKYSPDWQDMTTGLPRDNGDGLDFEAITFPDTEPGLYFDDATDLQFGTSNNQGFLDLTNLGTAPTYPVYTLHGPLETPSLLANISPTGGQSLMTYNDSLAAGQFVVIDPSVPSVMLGGTTDRRSKMLAANFADFAIPGASGGTPGSLSVSFYHAGPVTDAGFVDVTYRYAWW